MTAPILVSDSRRPPRPVSEVSRALWTTKPQPDRGAISVTYMAIHCEDHGCVVTVGHKEFLQHDVQLVRQQAAAVASEGTDPRSPAALHLCRRVLSQELCSDLIVLTESEAEESSDVLQPALVFHSLDGFP